MADDVVNRPAHYTQHPSGVECITITEHMGFNLGNAVKYIWRADLKGDALEDLRKAAWYVNREIERLSRPGGGPIRGGQMFRVGEDGPQPINSCEQCGWVGGGVCPRGPGEHE